MPEGLQFPVEFVVRGTIRNDDALVGLDVIQVVFARVHRDIQRRIQRFQLQAEVGHPQHDAAGVGRISRHRQRLAQEGRIIVVHPPGDGLVLPGSQRGELPSPVLRIGRGQLDAFAHILAKVRQEPQRPGGIQLMAQPAIGFVTGHVPGPMTTVMADIEGLIAFRSRCRMARRNGIIGIIPRREFHMGKELLPRGLCTGRPSQEQQAQ